MKKKTIRRVGSHFRKRSSRTKLNSQMSYVGLLLLLPLVRCTKTPPDIIFLLADDLGWDDVSFHGSSQIPTPNLDALAADGVILNSYYAQHACTPSRAALMTGLYPCRTGMEGLAIDVAEPWSLPTNIRILPQYLKDLGYQTHLVGKWHLGYYTENATPTFRGFDSFYGFYNGDEDYYTHSITYENHTGLDFWMNTDPVWSVNGTYSTTLYTKRAQYIIANRDKTKPLFLLLSYQAVHGADINSRLQAPQENVDKFPYIGEENRTIFAGMVDAMDQSVGEVFKALSVAGMLQNAVVVFSSDNGGVPFGAHASRSFNWPLRGVKGGLWEGATRSAAFLWSPLLERRRRVSHQLMHITDWLPTLYSIGGGDVKSLGNMDGLDMWRHLSQDLQSPRVEMLYNYDEWILHASALRSSRYKLVLDDTGLNNQRYHTTGGRRPRNDLDKLLTQSTVAKVLRSFYNKNQLNFSSDWRKRATLNCGRGTTRNFSGNDTAYLFDIVADPCELNNLASSLPEVVEFLKMRIETYAAFAISPLSPPKDPAGFPEYHNGTWAPWLDSVP
ncbi:arylsulfatase B-like isoform X1 [Dermacentor silvarum]|nr:arylsulfatase B-like isoform X1 [Dermacentor silvarum]